MTSKSQKNDKYLQTNKVYQGDARDLLLLIKPDSITVSVWSPPYHVGKKYEEDMTFQDWKNLLDGVIHKHYSIIKPGGFLVINIADILSFKDKSMPRITANNLSGKRIKITKNDIQKVLQKHPDWSKYKLADYFNCSEQTIQRRLEGVNIRGGKYVTQTKVKLVGGLIQKWAEEAGFYLYDRRIWYKDAAWESCNWHSSSYRSVDEFEYLYFFWKPGEIQYNRKRLSSEEWKIWGSRGVWKFPSVRSNIKHEAMFPIELPLRVIKMLSQKDDIILDCFMGSGTTAIAAIKLDRRYIGIEKEGKYVSLSNENISKITNQRKLDIKFL